MKEIYSFLVRKMNDNEEEAVKIPISEEIYLLKQYIQSL